MPLFKKNRGQRKTLVSLIKLVGGNKETRRVPENALEKLLSLIVRILFKIICAIWQLPSS